MPALQSMTISNKTYTTVYPPPTRKNHRQKIALQRKIQIQIQIYFPHVQFWDTDMSIYDLQNITNAGHLLEETLNIYRC